MAEFTKEQIKAIAFRDFITDFFTEAPMANNLSDDKASDVKDKILDSESSGKGFRQEVNAFVSNFSSLKDGIKDTDGHRTIGSHLAELDDTSGLYKLCSDYYSHTTRDIDGPNKSTVQSDFKEYFGKKGDFQRDLQNYREHKDEIAGVSLRDVSISESNMTDVEILENDEVPELTQEEIDAINASLNENELEPEVYDYNEYPESSFETQEIDIADIIEPESEGNEIVISDNQETPAQDEEPKTSIAKIDNVIKGYEKMEETVGLTDEQSAIKSDLEEIKGRIEGNTYTTSDIEYANNVYRQPELTYNGLSVTDRDVKTGTVSLDNGEERKAIIQPIYDKNKETGRFEAQGFICSFKPDDTQTVKMLVGADFKVVASTNDQYTIRGIKIDDKINISSRIDSGLLDRYEAKTISVISRIENDVKGELAATQKAAPGLNEDPIATKAKALSAQLEMMKEKVPGSTPNERFTSSVERADQISAVKQDVDAFKTDYADKKEIIESVNAQIDNYKEKIDSLSTEVRPIENIGRGIERLEAKLEQFGSSAVSSEDKEKIESALSGLSECKERLSVQSAYIDEGKAAVTYDVQKSWTEKESPVSASELREAQNALNGREQGISYELNSKISAASDLITSLKEQYPDIDKERMYIDKDNNMKINVDADRKSDEFKIGLRQDIKELRETNPNIGFKNGVDTFNLHYPQTVSNITINGEPFIDRRVEYMVKVSGDDGKEQTEYRTAMIDREDQYGNHDYYDSNGKLFCQVMNDADHPSTANIGDQYVDNKHNIVDEASARNPDIVTYTKDCVDLKYDQAIARSQTECSFIGPALRDETRTFDRSYERLDIMSKAGVISQDKYDELKSKLDTQSHPFRVYAEQFSSYENAVNAAADKKDSMDSADKIKTIHELDAQDTFKDKSINEKIRYFEIDKDCTNNNGDKISVVEEIKELYDNGTEKIEAYSESSAITDSDKDKIEKITEQDFYKNEFEEAKKDFQAYAGFDNRLNFSYNSYHKFALDYYAFKSGSLVEGKEITRSDIKKDVVMMVEDIQSGKLLVEMIGEKVLGDRTVFGEDGKAYTVDNDGNRTEVDPEKHKFYVQEFEKAQADYLRFEDKFDNKDDEKKGKDFSAWTDIKMPVSLKETIGFDSLHKFNYYYYAYKSGATIDGKLVSKETVIGSAFRLVDDIINHPERLLVEAIVDKMESGYDTDKKDIDKTDTGTSRLDRVEFETVDLTEKTIPDEEIESEIGNDEIEDVLIEETNDEITNPDDQTVNDTEISHNNNLEISNTETNHTETNVQPDNYADSEHNLQIKEPVDSEENISNIQINESSIEQEQPVDFQQENTFPEQPEIIEQNTDTYQVDLPDHNPDNPEDIEVQGQIVTDQPDQDNIVVESQEFTEPEANEDITQDNNKEHETLQEEKTDDTAAVIKSEEEAFVPDSEDVDDNDDDTEKSNAEKAGSVNVDSKGSTVTEEKSSDKKDIKEEIKVETSDDSFRSAIDTYLDLESGTPNNAEEIISDYISYCDEQGCTKEETMDKISDVLVDKYQSDEVDQSKVERLVDIEKTTSEQIDDIYGNTSDTEDTFEDVMSKKIDNSSISDDVLDMREQAVDNSSSTETVTIEADGEKSVKDEVRESLDTNKSFIDSFGSENFGQESLGDKIKSYIENKIDDSLHNRPEINKVKAIKEICSDFAEKLSTSDSPIANFLSSAFEAGEEVCSKVLDALDNYNLGDLIDMLSGSGPEAVETVGVETGFSTPIDIDYSTELPAEMQGTDQNTFDYQQYYDTNNIPDTYDNKQMDFNDQNSMDMIDNQQEITDDTITNVTDDSPQNITFDDQPDTNQYYDNDAIEPLNDDIDSMDTDVEVDEGEMEEAAEEEAAAIG